MGETLFLLNNLLALKKNQGCVLVRLPLAWLGMPAHMCTGLKGMQRDSGAEVV